MKFEKEKETSGEEEEEEEKEPTIVQTTRSVTERSVLTRN